MERTSLAGLIISLLLASTSQALFAHEPIFGISPHVLYKGGTEVALETHLEKTEEEKANEVSLDLVYGITGD